MKLAKKNNKNKNSIMAFGYSCGCTCNSTAYTHSAKYVGYQANNQIG